jgi:hypothetical protein
VPSDIIKWAHLKMQAFRDMVESLLESAITIETLTQTGIED